MAPGRLSVSAAVEGLVDEAVVRRLLEDVGAVAGPVYGKGGKQALHQKIAGYNHAAQFSPWVVLVDLDDDAECAPPFREAWLPQPAPKMLLRVAVRAVEAWLLADREHLSAFLGIPASRIPLNPDEVASPKRAMVELAARSRRREIREDMVPRPGSGRTVGPAYSSRLIEFASDAAHGWRPAIAAGRSDSLRRCLHRLRRLAQ